MSDVKNPSYYNRGKIEVWEFIEDQGLDYHTGNAVKYIARAGFKDPLKEVEDLQKAVAFLERKIKVLTNIEVGKENKTFEEGLLPCQLRYLEWRYNERLQQLHYYILEYRLDKCEINKLNCMAAYYVVCEYKELLPKSKYNKMLEDFKRDLEQEELL